MGIFTKAVTVLARNLGLLDPALYNFVGAGKTYAGENVTIDSAMQLDVVWACVRLISQTIATLPCLLYKRGKDGRGDIDDRHALYRILHDRPNADMTATEFWEAVIAALLLWGNAYIAIERINGRIVAIVPMRPDRITVQRQNNGSLVFIYTWQGIVERFNEDEIMHIKGFSLDGFVGISPIAQHRQLISSSTAAERTSGSFFKNAMTPSLVMKAPTYLNETQRARAKIILEEYSGSTNAGKIPLLEGGWDVQPLSLNPEDAQLIETRSFHVEQLCRIFDVPPAMIGHTEKTTSWGTALEQMLIWFLMFCIRPHIKRVEQAVHKSLLSSDEQTTHYAEFNVEGILRADSKARAEFYASGANNGWVTRNEIRARENLAPLPGGNTLTVQSALIPIEMLGKTPPTGAKLPPEPTNKEDKTNSKSSEQLMFEFSQTMVNAMKSQTEGLKSAVSDNVRVIEAKLEDVRAVSTEALKMSTRPEPQPQPVTLNVTVERGATKKTVTTRRDEDGNLVGDIVETEAGDGT